MQQRNQTIMEPEESETPPTRSRVLVRSMAMREETSPPREPHNGNHPKINLIPSNEASPEPGTASSPVDTDEEQFKDDDRKVRKKYHLCECQNQNCIKCCKTNNNNSTNVNNNTLTVTRCRGKLRQQSSSQGSFEGSSPCLSRDSSSEQYTDTTGVDLELFIPETLNRNAKDRALMLRIEQELVSLAKDKNKTHYKFPPMSSYQRMLVHRCAAYFGMDHNIEPTGKSVIVNKTKNTRIPDIEFKEHIKEDIVFSEEPRRSILKRDSNSIEDYSFKSPDRSFGSDNRRSKSFEEREEEYEKARRRIFNREICHGSSEDFGWSEMPWSSTDSDYCSRFRLQPPEFHRRPFGKLIKVHSEDTADPQRPCVAKSYSFGGYGGNVSVLTRGDSVLSTHSAGPRLLTKQDSGASSVSWRLSPSSSGYKSQSQMSESITPSPTSTPYPEESCEGRRIVWAVTDIQDVPKGSIIINPQSGKPFKNEDGTLYLYDPNNPPPFKPPPIPPSSPPQKIRELPSPTVIKTNSNKPIPSSPLKKSAVTNSSTSPSLPFSPPLSTTSSAPRRYSFVQDSYQAGYPNSYNGQSDGIYPQPYIVYTAPYLPQQYDGRIDAVPDLAGGYYITEGATNQTVPYVPPSAPQYWNQPVAFYPQNNATQPAPIPPQRYPAQPQTGFVTAGYPTNYLAAAQAAAQPPAPNHELVPVYPQPQPMQVIYHHNQSAAAPSNLIYPQPVVYTHNPVYQPAGPGYGQQQQNLPYPQGTPTPNSCTSSGFGIPESQTFVHLAQNMQQLSMNGPSPQAMVNSNKGPQSYDYRQQKPNPQSCYKQTNKFSKSFMMNSSQSSTGTNSPATTVIAANYCPQNPNLYRTPPETPPTQFAYPPNFAVPPVMFKQVRAGTPGTARSSRSPTPAGGELTFLDHRQRMPLAPNIYQGMPYVVSETRFIPTRNQQGAAFKTVQVNKGGYNQGGYNNNKNRKAKVNKQSGLPPSGK